MQLFTNMRKQLYIELGLDNPIEKIPPGQEAARQQAFRAEVEKMKRDPLFAHLFPGEGPPAPIVPSGPIGGTPKPRQKKAAVTPQPGPKFAKDPQGKVWQKNPVTGEYDIPVL